MARGTTLLALVGQLKVECGFSSSVSVNVDKLPEFKQLLARTQQMLWAEYFWPHLARFATLSLLAGQYQYDVPTGIDYEGIEQIANMSTGTPVPMDRGIDFEQYAIYDSVEDVRSDPATNWDIRDVSNAVQIEVWPRPVAAQTCKVKAQRRLRALVADLDVADLDDTLIVLLAATEILERAGSEDAKRKAALAASHMAALRARTHGNRPTRTMAGPLATARPRGHVTIRVAS